MDNEMKSNMKYVVAVTGAAIFMAAAYYLPAETFLAFFSIVLWIVPASFMVYIIQKMAKKDEEVDKTANEN